MARYKTASERAGEEWKDRQIAVRVGPALLAVHGSAPDLILNPLIARTIETYREFRKPLLVSQYCGKSITAVTLTEGGQTILWIGQTDEIPAEFRSRIQEVIGSAELVRHGSFAYEVGKGAANV